MELPSDEVLELLRCPVTKETLHRIGVERLHEINQQLADGQLRNRLDEVPSHPLVGGLQNASGTFLFPVYEHGPTLIADEALVPCAAQEGNTDVDLSENHRS